MKRAKLHEYNGQLYTVKELAKLSGKSRQCIDWRIKNGYSVRDAVDLPFGRAKNRTKAPCGFRSPAECLSCKYDHCISEDAPEVPGETSDKTHWKVMT